MYYSPVCNITAHSITSIVTNSRCHLIDCSQFRKLTNNSAHVLLSLLGHSRLGVGMTLAILKGGLSGKIHRGDQPKPW